MGKAQQYYKSIKDERNQWAASMPQVCMHCGKPSKWPGLEIHEIERRSHAPKTWFHLCNLLLLCQKCHAVPFATMPHAAQLALKWIKDRANFCLDSWLRLKDPELRAPSRVTLEEVLEQVERIQNANR